MPTLHTDIYSQQRSKLLEQQPKFSDLLPEQCPEMPYVRPISHVDTYHLLHDSANSHSSLQIIVGWGDGSVVHHVLDDGILKQKHTIIIIFKGEENAFAASMQNEFISKISGGLFHLTYFKQEEDLNIILHTHFSKHNDIPKLAGCEIIDQHPLCAEAETFRDKIKPTFYRCLADQPYQYGNDIYDGFTGIEFAARNAKSLLPAPTIGEMKGFFGDRPIISIAAGPSLQNHIDELRELQDRCILIACDAVLPGLINAGIEPHFVTPLERLEQSVKFLAYGKNTRTIFAGLPVIPPKGVSYYEDRCVGTYAGDAFYKWLLPENKLFVNTGTSTGVLSFTIAGILGTGDVYLVGHDLAKGIESTHWVGASEAANLLAIDRDQSDRVQGVMSGYDERIIPGNSGENVVAIAWWDRFRREIEGDVLRLSTDGRRCINVNINQKVGAVILGTVAGDLPKPQDLSPIGEIVLPARNNKRYEDWIRRASSLADDAHNLVTQIIKVKDDIQAMRKEPVAKWDLQSIADKLSIGTLVSEGNKDAFDYFLRSALHNSSAEMHLRRLTPSQARFKWQGMNTMSAYCDSLVANMETIIPKIEGILNDLTN